MIAAIGSLWGRVLIGGAARVVFGHGSPLCRCNQGANVLDSPNGNTRPKFHRFGEAPGSDAIPPAGFFYRDDRGNWRFRFGVANDLRQSKKAGFRKLVVHLHPSLSKWERVHPPFSVKANHRSCGYFYRSCGLRLRIGFVLLPQTYLPTFALIFRAYPHGVRVAR